MIRVERASAKINLGLEILGRRPDGYHEVHTILCAVSLADTLTFRDETGPTDIVDLQGVVTDVAPADNLVLKALGMMRDHGASIPPQRVVVEKRIPAAAGLGGASSDAAAALRAFAPELHAANADRRRIAATLGSDVPFFLDGPIALATGRGTCLQSLPPPTETWVVLVTPDLHIPDKTRTMYRVIDPAWWTDGSSVQHIAAQLPTLPRTTPANVFERALDTLYPESGRVRAHLRDAGAPFAALTGAGPTFYTLLNDGAHAGAVAGRIAASGLDVQIARLGYPDPTGDR